MLLIQRPAEWLPTSWSPESACCNCSQLCTSRSGLWHRWGRCFYTLKAAESQRLFLLLSSEFLIAMVHVGVYVATVQNKLDWRVGWKLLYDTRMTDCFHQPLFLWLREEGNVPGNPGFGPSSHGAVQLDILAFPNSLSTGLDNELRAVCQAVWVHFLTELRPFLHL